MQPSIPHFMLLPICIPARAVPAPESIHAEALAYFLGCMSREQLLGREDARDLAADVVAAVLPRLEQIDAPIRYLMSMCRHRLIRYLKKERTRARYRADDQPNEREVARVEEDASLDDHEARQLALIRCHLGRVDTLTRQIMELRTETDLTYAEIASLVGCRPATIRMRVLRFSRRVRLAWEQKEGDTRNQGIAS